MLFKKKIEMNYQLVLCTCPNDNVAKEIAKHLVTEKLAACVNITSGITSIYTWQGQVESTQEVQLIIKSTEEHFELISKAISTLHPYDIPEIIALNIQQGDTNYLNWITESLK